MVQVLKQCGDDLSRENIMKQAANLKDLELPMLLPGIKINTSPDNFSPIRQRRSPRSTARAGSSSASSIRPEAAAAALPDPRTVHGGPASFSGLRPETTRLTPIP